VSFLPFSRVLHLPVVLKELSESRLMVLSFDLFAEDVADEQNSAANGSTSSFLVLETIFEENSDDLETEDSASVSSNESDTSDSDDDFESVIHISPGKNYTFLEKMLL